MRRRVSALAHFACGAIALSLALATSAGAEELTFSDLKAKIFDARMALKTFVNGLRFCGELDGTNFYFEPRNRVLSLEDYHQSLDNLVKAQAFNPEKKKPWTAEDANARWEQAKKKAQQDKEICKLVAMLPELEKRLQAIEHKAEEPKKTQ